MKERRVVSRARSVSAGARIYRQVDAAASPMEKERVGARHSHLREQLVCIVRGDIPALSRTGPTDLRRRKRSVLGKDLMWRDFPIRRSRNCSRRRLHWAIGMLATAPRKNGGKDGGEPPSLSFYQLGRRMPAVSWVTMRRQAATRGGS
jgi:hypothetical protein